MIDNKRFKEMVGYLKDNRYIRNQQDFVERVNSDKTTVSQIMNDKIPAPNIMFGNISAAFPFISIEWLKHGEGEMLKESNDKICQDGKGEYITYLLPMRAMGGSLTGIAQDGVSLQNCEQVISPIKGIDFAITVYGESMAPEYPSGSRILIKQINPNLFIDWGKVYVLDTPNGIVVKEIRQSEREGYISCYSINPDPKFKPFDIPMCEIFGIYRVLMCLSAK
ncbi:MAG: S24 family peptidase [Coprobacter sp.]|nr:S24 family peptidase [Coprobacter sp.]